MAGINPLFSSGRGKLGNMVFYQKNGKNNVRTKPGHFIDKKSLAQRQQMQFVIADNMIMKTGLSGEPRMVFPCIDGAYPFVLMNDRT